MQLSLLSRLRPDFADSRRGPPSTVPGAWRDSATMQLDSIAAANDLLARQTRRRRLWAIAGLSGATALLALAWQSPRGEQVPVRLAAPTQLQPTQIATPAVVPVTLPPVTAVPVTEVPAAAAEDVAPKVDGNGAANTSNAIILVNPVAAPASADARRKAALAAKERARSEEEVQQRLRLAQEQQRQEAERAQQLADAAARERTAAAEQAARRQAEVVVARAPVRGVREVCGAGSGLFGEVLCQQRECRKADLQADPVCARLREIEVSRQQQFAEH